MDDRSEGRFRYRELVDALEEGRRKIKVFRRELPLSLHLINQTIENYLQLMMKDIARSSDEHVLKEFIPLKPSSDISDENKHGDMFLESNQERMASAQLWGQDSNPELIKDHIQKPVAVKANKISEDDHPGDGDKEYELASQEGEGNNGEDENKCRSRRKARRCWSEDLHKRFLNALQQLGGCHGAAATPKRIRALMKVEGLTNDEVKSHLQKYRIHARRSNPGVAVENPSTGVPQLVLVGGIWIPCQYPVLEL